MTELATAFDPELGLLAQAIAIAQLDAASQPLPRDPAERRAYVGRPADYVREILGVRVLTSQQERMLDLMAHENRVLIPKANAIGGSFLLAAFGIYVLDVLGAELDDESGDEQGARVILMGPDHASIEGTVYAEMLLHARNAERLGHALPGRRSENSVLWSVRPAWEVVAFSPPKYTMQTQAHGAAGRHARAQVVLVTEGAGVSEALWKAADGLASSRGNKIIAETNPTEPTGPFYQRAKRGGWYVLHLSALDHPNVQERRYIVPGAIDFRVIDRRVRTGCVDRGLHSEVPPDLNFGDFLYALPTPGVDTGEGDGLSGELGGLPVRGHARGQVRVYRPGVQFQGQVLGQFPTGVDAGLFAPGAWDAGVERWRAGMDPDAPPDAVGFDVAREGDDDSMLAPRWGLGAEELLRRHADAVAEVNDARLEELRETQRARVGALRTLPKGDGPAVAEAAARLYSRSPWNVDETGVGSSVLDHARRVFGLDVTGVSFASSALAPLPGEEWAENLKTTLYLRAAALVRLGLVDPPDDDALREEILAHELLHGSRTVEVRDERGTRKERKPSVRVLDKDTVKRRIGRSPDRADAFVLALFSPALRGGGLPTDGLPLVF